MKSSLRRLVFFSFAPSRHGCDHLLSGSNGVPPLVYLHLNGPTRTKKVIASMLDAHLNSRLNPSADSESLIVPNQSVRSRKSRELPREMELSGKQILLIEDFADARFLFTRILTRQSAHVIGVDSAIAARRALVSCKPDLIISDIGLPHEDGLSFIRSFRLSELFRGERTPAIAITAFGDLKDKALAAGFDAFLEKPFAGSFLVKAIRDVLHFAQPILH